MVHLVALLALIQQQPATAEAGQSAIAKVTIEPAEVAVELLPPILPADRSRT
jgi:hypothetical protein